MPSRTLGELVVDLEARTSKMEASLDRAGRELKRSRQKFTKEADLIKRAFIGLVSVEALRRAGTAILQTADQMTQLRGRVQNATKATGDFQRVWGDLGKIAASTGTELKTTVEVFQRLTIARSELNATNDQLLKFTNSVQQLGIISGASTGAMAAGLTQLGQGLSAGVLRAEEFNSIVENIPAVAQAIAQGMGLTVGQLRAAVLEGQVLSRDVLDSILSQTGEIAQQFEEMPPTIQRAASELRTEFALLIDQLNESLGLTKLIAGALQSMAEDIRRNFAEGERGIDLIYRRIKELEAIPNAGRIIANVLGLDFAESDELKGLRDVASFLEAARQSETRLEGAHKSLTGATETLSGAMDDKNEKLTAQEKKTRADAAAAIDAAISTGVWAESLTAVDDELQVMNDLTDQQSLNYWSAQVEKASQDSKEWTEALKEVEAELENAQRLAELWEISTIEIMEDTIRSVRGAWSDFFYDVFQGEGIDSFADFVDTIKDMFLRLLADLAAAWVTKNIFGGLLNIGGAGIFGVGGAGGGGIGSLGLGALGSKIFGGGAAAGGSAAVASALPAVAAIPAGIPLGTAAATTAVGGPIAAGQAAAFGVTSAGSVPVAVTSISSGAGGAAIGSGLGGLAGAGAAFGPVIAAYMLLGGTRTSTDILQGLQGSGQTEQLARRGGAFLGGEELDPLAAFLGGSGAGIDKVPGLGFTANIGGREDEYAGIKELVEQFRELKRIMPELQETAASTFESMNIGAQDLSAAFLNDGVLDAVESAQLGFAGLGDVSAEQFARIAAAVDQGVIRIEALRGETAYTSEELAALGVLGVKSMSDLAAETGKTDEQLERLKETAREALRETGDGFAYAGREADGAANSVGRLANEIRSLPAVPVGVGEGRHSGGSFDVRRAASGASFMVSGAPGVDANLVQLFATQGERVTVETPGVANRGGGSAPGVDRLVTRLDRLLLHLEAA